MSKNIPTLGLQQHDFDHQGQTLTWLSHSHIKPPQQLQYLAKQEHLSADQALKLWRDKTATVWQGDYHQAKALLDAVKRRLHKPLKPADSTLETFHKWRLQQQQRSQVLSHLLVEVAAGWQLSLPRAPNIQAACQQAFGFDNEHTALLPLHALLGYIGAEQWHQRGIAISALDDAHIHVPFGVFSPLRGEYLDLLSNAALPQPCHSAWDIGTGSGVLAAILAKRGISDIIATDTNPVAIATAKANFTRLGVQAAIHVVERDLFPEGQADLIVCNPPWLPAKPSAMIETALYDPNSQMLRAFLDGAAAHLSVHGQAWLIMSNLAELIGLRDADDLNTWITAAGLRIVAKHNTAPKHAKAQDANDVLHAARSQEVTSLYCLMAAN
ncbi:class I SAM-dependent methyltransferase [Vitreoscilla massiliensis]|uniref:Class I SAM-dependent methyltransferase n=1 Tax=Vitreoscilla massiliensis TaxID=1689272 RepID=A0ABY4E6X6_9NEIS|nr:class I SAM-dependent methyltransferase [Vitreoscilla massiliensis]UOO90630.1 class I SAM-dependent methyltransferase [Vitreoscilla massiliensis]